LTTLKRRINVVDGQTSERTAVEVNWQFVGAVKAVLGLIAFPRRRNAAAVLTAEQSRLAGSTLTLALVGCVAAVVRTVADLERQRTVEIVALELTRPTVTHRYTRRS